MSLMPNEFLIEEVRNGFMVPAQIKQFWAAELEVLSEIDRVCKKHDIEYFADWGTLLGAVRHGGFIPWDDDLDIVMKREDYRRFLQVAKTELKEGYCVQTYNELEYGNWLFMGKVVNKERACFEAEHLREFHNFPFIACVDLFVLDYVYKDEEKEKTRRELCLFLLATTKNIVEGQLKEHQIRNILDDIKQKWGLSLRYIADPIAMGRYIYSVIEEQFALVEEQDADYLCQQFPWGLKGVAPYYPKRYYEKSISIPFEYTTMPVPLAFDRMLKDRYGDYFKINRSGGAHDYPCFEKSKKIFYESLGMEENKYKFSEDELHIRERIKKENDENPNFKQTLSMLLSLVGIPHTIDEAADIQQAAIDMGELIEYVLGENNSVVRVIEEYCEALYGYVTAIDAQEEVDDFLVTIEQKKNELVEIVTKDILEKKFIVILPVYAKEWKTVSRIWNKYRSDSNNEVIVVPLNYYYKDYDGSPRVVEYEIDKLPDEVNAFHIDSMPLEKLMLLHPDEIVITNGYDQWHPNISVNPMYYSENLIGCTDKLAYYMPYDIADFDVSDERAWHNMKYYIECPGVLRADEILVDREQIKAKVIERIEQFSGHYQDEWNNIIRVMDDVSYNGIETEELDINSKTEKRLLYCINVSSLIEYGDKALYKIKNSIELMKHSHEIEVTMCTYPEINDDVSDTTDKAIIDGVERMIALSEINVKKYSRIKVKEYDAYFGDGSPAMLDFIEDNKPVMVQNYAV